MAILSLTNKNNQVELAEPNKVSLSSKLSLHMSMYKYAINISLEKTLFL